MNKKTSIQTEALSLRIDESNPNHHLWFNNGTWWIHYTIYPTPVTAARIRRSLKTADILKARELRDEFFKEILSTASQLAA